VGRLSVYVNSGRKGSECRKQNKMYSLFFRLKRGMTTELKEWLHKGYKKSGTRENPLSPALVIG
jgi:hypothetical protein